MPEVPGSILNDTVLGKTVLSDTVLSKTVLNPSGIWPAPTCPPSLASAHVISQPTSPPTIYPAGSAWPGGGGYSNVRRGAAAGVIALVGAGVIIAGIFGYAHTPGPTQTQQQSTVNQRTLYAGYRLQYWVYPGRITLDNSGYARTGERYRVIGKVGPNYDEIQFLDRPYDGERFVVRHSDVTGPSSMNNRSNG
jgi:hypothetical protein